MRLRYNKNATNNLLNDEKYFLDTSSLSNFDPNTCFINKNPIYLEIGMGKGNFIIANAEKYPHINFLGLEKFDTVLWKAVKKAQEKELNNLRLISYDAIKISELFQANSIAKIYLNFSDPWPKARHDKRRLTHPNFLNQYKEILIEDGIIEFKTDNDDLFNWTINEVLEANQENYEIIYKTNDLYNNLNNHYNKDNIPTEYETKFHNLGKNINKVIFKFKSYKRNEF